MQDSRNLQGFVASLWEEGSISPSRIPHARIGWLFRLSVFGLPTAIMPVLDAERKKGFGSKWNSYLVLQCMFQI